MNVRPKLFEFVHNHGHIVGFRHRKRFIYPHKPAVEYHCPHVYSWLYRRSEILSACPGGQEHMLRHDEEHRNYRVKRGLTPTDYAQDEEI